MCASCIYGHSSSQLLWYTGFERGNSVFAVSESANEYVCIVICKESVKMINLLKVVIARNFVFAKVRYGHAQSSITTNQLCLCMQVLIFCTLH